MCAVELLIPLVRLARTPKFTTFVVNSSLDKLALNLYLTVLKDKYGAAVFKLTHYPRARPDLD